MNIINTQRRKVTDEEKWKENKKLSKHTLTNKRKIEISKQAKDKGRKNISMEQTSRRINLKQKKRKKNTDKHE